MSGSHRSHPSRDNLGEGSSSRAPPPHAFSSPRPILPPLQHVRYVGDGFDFRRPVMSTPTQPENVIDLTNESSPPTATQTQAGHSPAPRQSRGSRAPRFGREIMADVVDLREEPDTGVTRPQSLLSSPEVQILRPPREARNTHQGLASQTAETLARGTNALTDMIMRLRDGGIPRSNVVGEDALRREVARRTRDVLQPRRQPDEERIWLGNNRNEGVDLTVDLDNGGVLDMPLNLDYQTAGFALVDPPGTQAPPSYKPPTPAPEGFTRTTTDNDTLVCPSCQEELGAGENPIKQQIWVAKPCGHVSASLYHSICWISTDTFIRCTVVNAARTDRLLV